MAVFAGHHRRAARPADGIGNQAAVEPHPLARDPVEVRRLNELARIVVGTDRLIRVVIGEDEDDVRSLGLGGPRQRATSRQNAGEKLFHVPGFFWLPAFAILRTPPEGHRLRIADNLAGLLVHVDGVTGAVGDVGIVAEHRALLTLANLGVGTLIRAHALHEVGKVLVFTTDTAHGVAFAAGLLAGHFLALQVVEFVARAHDGKRAAFTVEGDGALRLGLAIVTAALLPRDELVAVVERRDAGVRRLLVVLEPVASAAEGDAARRVHAQSPARHIHGVDGVVAEFAVAPVPEPVPVVVDEVVLERLLRRGALPK